MKKVFFYFCLLFTLICLIYIINQPRMSFIQKEIHLSLHDEIRPYDYIKNTKDININKIHISHNINNRETGKYHINYQYENHVFTLDIYIDDTIPPYFETKNVKILMNQTITPESLIKELHDDSPTMISFKENYVFNESKTYKVIIVVEDSFKNRSEKLSYVLVEEKDVEKPVLQGITKLTILQGDQIDLKKGINILDDHDHHPRLTIDDSSLNINKIGEYDVYYHVEDYSGNKDIYTRSVEVLSQYASRDAISDGIKTCYLTFDDGPSSNTKLILDILDDYSIKATFFVSGTSPDHFHYIKEAYEKGHIIGLHTYSHDYEEIYSSLKNYIKDLNKIKELVYKQTGSYSPYMRFAGGSSNLVSKKYNVGIMKRLVKKVVDLGYQYYDWTSINGDGENIKTVNGLKKKAIEEIDGKEDIMFLMHDSPSCINTVKALPSIIDYLIKEGYTFETIEKSSPTFHHIVKN